MPSRIRHRTAISLALMCTAVLAFTPATRAGTASPVGEWRTIDDSTHQAKAIVKIFEHDGKLYGTVEKSLIPNPLRRTCDGCTDDRKNKPVLGMEIIRGLKQDGDRWDGGTILDPETGQVYKCHLTLRDNGDKLAVRGFVGIALLGRTQVWERVH